MTPEMNTAGFGGLKKIREIICTSYLEGKNEKESTHTMQKKKKKWHFWQLIYISNHYHTCRFWLLLLHIGCDSSKRLVQQYCFSLKAESLCLRWFLNPQILYINCQQSFRLSVFVLPSENCSRTKVTAVLQNKINLKFTSESQKEQHSVL